MGAYLQLVTPGIPLLGAWIYSGPYEIPNYSVTFTGVFTHTTPTDAYRGAGRPEATYVLERTMDALARELGMDPLELRRKNFVTEFPHTMASGLTIDSGDYHATLDRLLELLDLDAIRADQATRRARAVTRSRSASASRPTTRCAASRRRASSARSATRSEAGTRRRSASSRSARSRSSRARRRTARATRRRGRRSSPTSSACDVDDVEVLHGDTAVSQLGMDTYGSRSLAVGGIALYHASQKIIAKARQIVAHQLEVSEDDLEFADGTFTREGLARPDDDASRPRRSRRTRPTTSPTAWSRGSRRRRSTTRRTSPGRRARTRRSSRSTRRRATRGSSATSRSTTSAPPSTRRSSTGRCTAASRRASRRRSTRRASTTRRATC